MSGGKNLKRGEVLFREGDASEAMYVIKSGKIAIVKTKGKSEITLAELSPGDMLGEMAFFDNRPRSAGARAIVDSVVIELPFKALNSQFKTFPEWLKAIVRTMNNHLRNANTKIKNFEQTNEDESTVFTPHMITRLMGVIGLVTARYGDNREEGVVVSQHVLRRYTIQVYQLPTNKLQRLMSELEVFGYMRVEELGEGKQKITVLKLDDILNLVDFYSEWLFKPEEKRVVIDAKEVLPLKSLVHYGALEKANAEGMVCVNLTKMQSSCIKDLGRPFSIDDVNRLTEKKVVPEKVSGDDGIALSFHFAEIKKIAPIWELIHHLLKLQRD